jgi:hypothetical protein
MNSTRYDQELSIAPLGPGDLIDRAVRFYRKNFGSFVTIAAPPVILGTALGVVWLVLGRWLFPEGSNTTSPEIIVYYLFTTLGTITFWVIQTVVTLAIMGGASRNFVRHILFGERITFRETYRNTWGRIGGLIAASLFITLVLGIVGFAVIYIGLFVGVLLGFGMYAAFGDIETIASVFALVAFILASIFSLLLFFLIASRFAYVPQVMLVEGRGVFQSVGRSFSLARGNMRRFTALLVFTVVATYSALAILYVPLGWYAWFEGVSLFGMDQDLTPAWFAVASQLVWQASLILLSPIWMVGLCLLYVDERVRHEGYDIELLAVRRLGEIPDVPDLYVNPLEPALAAQGPGTSTVSPQPTENLGLK